MVSVNLRVGTRLGARASTHIMSPPPRPLKRGPIFVQVMASGRVMAKVTVGVEPPPPLVPSAIGDPAPERDEGEGRVR